MEEWISIYDRLPESLETVLLYDEVEEVNIGYYFTKAKTFICQVDGHRLNNVTHWMPRPQAPGKESRR